MSVCDPHLPLSVQGPDRERVNFLVLSPFKAPLPKSARERRDLAVNDIPFTKPGD